MPYFTQRLVDDFASHIRLYRRATDRVNMSQKDGMIYIYFVEPLTLTLNLMHLFSLGL